MPVYDKVRYHQPLIFGISNVPRSHMRPLRGNARRKQTRTLWAQGKRDILDVVVDDAALVEELDTGQKRTEPFLGMRLRHFNSDEPRMVCPVDMKKIRVSRIL